MILVPRLFIAAVVATCCTLPAAAETLSFRPTRFDDIKLELKADEEYIPKKHLSDKVAKFDGQKIRISGWIHPGVFQREGITEFVLCRDNKECCFGEGAALHDCIYVTMEPGTSVDFTTLPIVVEGTFRIEPILSGNPKRPQNAIYQMKATSARKK